MELEKAVLSKGCTILFRTHGVRFGEVVMLCYQSSSEVLAEYSLPPNLTWYLIGSRNFSNIKIEIKVKL